VVSELPLALEHHDPQWGAWGSSALDQPAIQLGDLCGEGQAGNAPADDRYIYRVDLSILRCQRAVSARFEKCQPS
jgi:hypothetical protein